MCLANFCHATGFIILILSEFNTDSGNSIWIHCSTLGHSEKYVRLNKSYIWHSSPLYTFQHIIEDDNYCELNEIKSKHFPKKFHKFTNSSFRMVITWKTRSIRSLFPLKDKNDYKSCVIYKGDCSCGSRYIGETKRNAEVWWNEHNNPTKSSEPSKQLWNNINHYFTWAVISNVPKMLRPRRT